MQQQAILQRSLPQDTRQFTKQAWDLRSSNTHIKPCIQSFLWLDVSSAGTQIPHVLSKLLGTIIGHEHTWSSPASKSSGAYCTGMRMLCACLAVSTRYGKKTGTAASRASPARAARQGCATLTAAVQSCCSLEVQTGREGNM